MMIPPVGINQYDYTAPVKLGVQAAAIEPAQAAGPAAKGASPQDNAGIQAPGGVAGQDALKRLDEVECQTCANRRYQDGSDDPSVSMQSPTKVDAKAAASTVRKHEYEHVNNEQADAEQEGREVVSQSVRLHTDICPECGKVYVSGGETRTTTRADNDEKKAEDEKKKAVQGLATPYRSMKVDERT